MVPAVDDIEVHVIRLEPFQALVDLAQDGLARQPGPVRALVHASVEFGGDDDLVAIREVSQGAPENRLTGAKRIDVGGIEKVDTELECPLDDRPAVRLVQNPFVKPALGVAEAHTTEADS